MPKPTLTAALALAALAASAAGAPAQDEAPDWQLVTAGADGDLFYDANTVLQTEDGIRVRTRAVPAAPAPLPGTAGASGDYASEVTVFLLDCDAAQYAVAERAWFDAENMRLADSTDAEAPQAYEADGFVGRIAGMVCPLPVTPRPAQ